MNITMKIYVHDCEAQVRLFTFKKVHRAMVPKWTQSFPRFLLHSPL